MPWEEFVRHFTDISVCQLLNTQSTLEQGLSRQKSLAKASRRSIATIGMPEKQFREWASGWARNEKPSHSIADILRQMEQQRRQERGAPGQGGRLPQLPRHFLLQPPIHFRRARTGSGRVDVCAQPKG